MNRGDKIFICILLLAIIIFAIVLIYNINSSRKPDKQLYDEVYAEYETMLTSIEEENNTGENSVQEKDNTIYIRSNLKGEQYRVAGEICIPKISIKYPIIFETTEEYLKIAPTKLFGPDINEVGNLCIVGHNYKNEKFFSKLSELEKNDKVYLMSNQGKTYTYTVYDKYEVNETDMSCTSQETNGNVEVTLITCTKNKHNRLVVKCRAIEDI